MMTKQNNILFFPLVVTLIFTGVMLCNAQVSQEWVARYHFYSDDQARDIAVDDSGNVYVTGKSEVYTPGGAKPDYATVKYNSAGILQWVQRYNGAANEYDEATSIAVDDSGNVYVTGFSRSGSTAIYNDFATIKYNSSGIQQWVRRYNGGGSDIPYKILIDSNGDILVGGWSSQPVTGPDFTVIKYNSDGDSLWVRTYDSGESDNQYDYAVSMAIDISDNVYLTGSFGLADWGTVKWSSNGQFQWANRFNGPGGGSDYAKSLAVDNSGNVYVTGYVWRNNAVNFATIKFDSSGEEQWSVYHSNASAIDIAVDDSSNAYVTGATGDIMTVKYNALGIEQWAMNFNGPGNAADIPCCIQLDDSANVYVAGYTTVNSSNTDFCIIKYNSFGIEQWMMNYNGTGNSYDQPTAMILDKIGNVYVAGSSRGPGNNDYATIKYSQTVGINQISSEIPIEFKLYQNYPNPFNPETKIKFEIKNSGLVTLKVYDALGREIKALVNDKISPGKYEVNFNAGNLNSGVYYYKLNAEGYSDTKKMILIK